MGKNTNKIIIKKLYVSFTQITKLHKKNNSLISNANKTEIKQKQ